MTATKQAAHKFSKPDNETFQLTPLAAAVVEAMPDRKRISKIRRRFRVNFECPSSAIFNAAQIVEFYKRKGMSIQSAREQS